MIHKAHDEQKHRFLHAYPSTEKHASNAICRKTGFTLEGAEEFEYPPSSGKVMRCNIWRFELFASRLKANKALGVL